ncbi:hypothetical protein NKH18_48930 [Streptomyces sp. M10(2022)]
MLGPGSPVAGFSSWSAKERPDTRAQQPLALTIADLRLRLDFLIIEAVSWDPRPQPRRSYAPKVSQTETSRPTSVKPTVCST